MLWVFIAGYIACAVIVALIMRIDVINNAFDNDRYMLGVLAILWPLAVIGGIMFCLLHTFGSLAGGDR